MMSSWSVVLVLTALSCECLSLLSEDGPRSLPPEEERRANCPPEKNFGEDCTCWTTTFGGLYLECTGLESRPQLRSAFAAVEGQPMFGLGLINSSLSHLPSGVLSGGLQALYLSGTSLTALRGPGPSPFQEVSRTLVHLDVQRERSAYGWRWMDLSPLVRIRTLSLKDSDVRSLDRGMSLGLSPVRFLSFVNCRIEQLNDQVFSSLSRLVSLDLSRNQIPTVTRSMLPEEAPDLLTINLRHNRLRTLEKGTFKGLNGLQVLDLGYNQLTTLEQTNFRPILMNIKKHVYLAGNPLWCDCRLRWILTSFRGEDNQQLRDLARGAACWRPLELEDRPLDGLRVFELASCRESKHQQDTHSRRTSTALLDQNSAAWNNV